MSRYPQDNDSGTLNFGCEGNCPCTSTESCCCADCPASAVPSLCYSPSSHHPSDLSPRSQYSSGGRGLYDSMAGGPAYMSVARGEYQSPPGTVTSTPSSGQGPSHPRPINQQPGYSTPMEYPSCSGYGALYPYDHQYFGQSPASMASGLQEYPSATHGGDGSSASYDPSEYSAQHDVQDSQADRGEGQDPKQRKGKEKAKEKTRQTHHKKS